MNYRYGDATPFPVDENFVDTVVAATEVCVALCQADLGNDSRRAKAQLVRALAEEELARLTALGQWVEGALEPLVPAPNRKAKPGSQQAAQRILKQARETVKQYADKVKTNREQAVRTAMGEHLPSRVRELCDPFLLRHQLPRTRWSFHWVGRPRALAAALIDAHCAQRLRVRFASDLSQGFWSQPVRIGDLVRHFELPLAGRGGRMKNTSLLDYTLVEIEGNADREVMRLQKGKRPNRPGFRIMLRSGEHATPVITPIDGRGARTGLEVVLAGDGVDQVNMLWSEIQIRLPEMIARRRGVMEATLADRSLSDLERPAELAEALLNILAPVLREMRQRSPIPGQLMLKRLVEDGTFEELLVPRAALEERFLRLPEQYWRMFVGAGLGNDPDATAVHRRELPLAAVERPEAQPAGRISRRLVRRLPTERMPTEPFSEFEIDVDPTDTSAA